MTFVDSVFGEAGLLELPVNIAREHESATGHAVRPSAQNREALVRDRLTVELQTVSVEAHASSGCSANRAGFAMSSNERPRR